MAKKKLTKKLIGRSLNIWDVLVFSIISYYIYGVYVNIGGSLWRVFELFAGAIFFAYIVFSVNKYVKKKQRR